MSESTSFDQCAFAAVRASRRFRMRQHQRQPEERQRSGRSLEHRGSEGAGKARVVGTFRKQVLSTHHVTSRRKLEARPSFSRSFATRNLPPVRRCRNGASIDDPTNNRRLTTLNIDRQLLRPTERQIHGRRVLSQCPEDCLQSQGARFRGLGLSTLQSRRIAAGQTHEAMAQV